jgi:hypothetical protein
VGVALEEAHSFIILDVLRAIDDGNHFLLGTNGSPVLVFWAISSRSLSAGFQSHQTSIRTCGRP